MFTVQGISEKDIKEVAALEKAVFPDPWSETSLQDTLRQSHALILGAWTEEKLAGYVILYYVLDEGEIARIAVDKSMRRRGAATALLKVLVDICTEKGIVKLMLDVRKSNDPAIRFYKRYGFSEDGVRRSFYVNPTEDAILMSKMLGK